MVRSNSVVIANGNNLIIQGDLTRRTICGRMDAGVERPELLKFEYSPLDDARENRAELVMACLTVLRAYHVAGRPVREVLGGFEQWSYLIRGALIWLGEADPAATMEELHKNDPVLSGLRSVMFEWGKMWKPGVSITVHDMVQRATEYRRRENGVGEFVNASWREAMMSVAGWGGGVDGDRFGKWLRRNKDRLVTFNNTGKEVMVKIEKGKLLHGRQMWALTRVEVKVEQQQLL